MRLIKYKQLKKLLMALVMLIGLGIAIPASTYAATPAAWSLHPSADEAKTWRDVAWSPELKIFVAISSNSVMTSPDGISWTFHTTPTGSWASVAWSPEAGKFVAVGIGSSNNMIYSSDGINWATAPIGVNALNAITWSPEKHQFVAVGISVIPSVTIAPDLTVTPAAPGALGLTGITWSKNDNIYVATAGGTGLGKTYVSNDGLSWTLNNTPPVDGPWNDIKYTDDQDLFIIVGTNGVMTSKNGVTWTPQTSPLTNLITVTYSPENGEFVVVGDGGGIQTSPDGVNWTVIPLSTTNNWRGITWSPELSRYVGVANAGTNLVLVGLVPKVSNPPLNLTATSLVSTKVNLSWSVPTFDGNSAITGYRIERSANGGAFNVLVANTSSPATTYTDATTTTETSYTYRIYALNAQGQSIASNVAGIHVGAMLADTGMDQYKLIAGASVLVLAGAMIIFRRLSIRNSSS